MIANPDPESIEPFEWRDTQFVSLGAELKLNERFTLRAGLAFDETPTHIETRTPRMPDDDRIWYSVGGTWNASDALEINFGYTRIEVDSAPLNLDAGGSRLAGSFDGHADLYGVSAQYRF